MPPSLLGSRPCLIAFSTRGCKSNEGGIVKVSAHQESGNIIIDITDTGLGGLPAEFDGSAQGQGYGLGQVRERLMTVFGTAAQIKINTSPGKGTQVTLQWPQQ